MTLIKITKQGSSNKSKSLGENEAPLPKPQVHVPFIDKISVTLKVPTAEDGVAIYSGIIGQFKDASIFKSAKKAPDYSVAKRIALASVVDPKKWPHLQYASDGAAKLAERFRIEFVPVDLGHSGLSELHSVLASIMPNGWDYFVQHGRVTRLDVAVDLPEVSMRDFHFLPKQGATTSAWGADGHLQTFQHGKAKGSHTSIYDRKAKRQALKKPWKGKEGVRVERRLKQQYLPLKDLGELDNPFASLAMVHRYPTAPVDEKKPYIWQLFLNAADHVGLPAALALLPPEKRTVYRKHLKLQALAWWDAHAIWANWSNVLEETKIASETAWF